MSEVHNTATAPHCSEANITEAKDVATSVHKNALSVWQGHKEKKSVSFAAEAPAASSQSALRFSYSSASSLLRTGSVPHVVGPDPTLSSSFQNVSTAVDAVCALSMRFLTPQPFRKGSFSKPKMTNSQANFHRQTPSTGKPNASRQTYSPSDRLAVKGPGWRKEQVVQSEKDRNLEGSPNHASNSTYFSFYIDCDSPPCSILSVLLLVKTLSISLEDLQAKPTLHTSTLSCRLVISNSKRFRTTNHRRATRCRESGSLSYCRGLQSKHKSHKVKQIAPAHDANAADSDLQCHNATAGLLTFSGPSPPYIKSTRQKGNADEEVPATHCHFKHRLHTGIVERATTFLKRGDSPTVDPLLLDQYVAVTDYEKQESSEISLCVGQVVEVIEKNESGWWFVSTEEAQGWVPATCLEAQDDPDDFTIPGEEVPRRFWSLPRHMGRRRTLGDLFGSGPEEKYSVIYPYSARDQDEIDLERGMVVEVVQKNLEGWWKIKYQGKEGWAPASYLKKADIQNQKPGAAVHSSTNDLDGYTRQNHQNNALKDNRDNNHKENRLSFFSESKNKLGLRHRPPPRRDLSIPRGAKLPKPPVPPQVEEEYYTIADFQTTIPDGISFTAGIKVEVVEKNGSGWWYIQIDDKEGWAPATFIDKYKKTSNALRPNFLAPLPNEMERLTLEDNNHINSTSTTDNTWSKPLPDEPTATESFIRPKLRDWKTNKAAPAFTGPLPPAPSAPPSEEKPALPPRRESIHKSLELEVAEKSKPDPSKPLPPKPPAPGVIVPLVKPPPFKAEKPADLKKEDKSKALHLRNEMGLECGHKISAKEVKKFNLKPVPKQPPKPRQDSQEEKQESTPAPAFMKPKPSVKPKPVPAAKPEIAAENKLDITNLRSKLRPSKATDSGLPSESNGVAKPSSPTSSPPIHIPSLNNKPNEELPKIPPKHINGHSQERTSSPPPKPAVPLHKEPPQRPPAMLPKRPPPPKKSDPSSPTEPKPAPILKEDIPKPPQLGRPPPPKPKAFTPIEPKANKVPIPPKPQIKSDKPGPPSKLPPLLKELSKEELYLAVADFEGDEQTAGFKIGAVFEVLEKNSNGWWFCKNVGEEVEGWIPSNYLSKKP